MVNITEEMREESPYMAMYCEIVNEALALNPQMSLLEFAERINREEQEYAIKKRYRRLQAAERKQFGGIN